MPAIPWMQTGPFGLMVHYLSHIQPRSGVAPIDGWDRMVDAFPVEAFCDTVVATGAKWLILPFGQNTGLYCSPNAYLESIKPGHCSRRDLWRQIASNLTARGVRMIAYIPAEMDMQSEPLRKAFQWDAHPRDKRIYEKHFHQWVRAWAEPMGKLISGWWFDGCYNAAQKSYLRTRDWDIATFDLDEWFAAARAGNPSAVIALNPGVDERRHQPVTIRQDYLAGETNTLAPLPESALQDGMQWHTLTWLDCFWMHDKPGEIPPPRFTDEELFKYGDACHEKGGGVTLNVGIYQDGTLAEATVEQVKRLAKHMA